MNLAPLGMLGQSQTPNPKNLGITLHAPSSLVKHPLHSTPNLSSLNLRYSDMGSRSTVMSWSQHPRPSSAPTANQLVYYTMVITPLPSRTWNAKRINLLTPHHCLNCPLCSLWALCFLTSCLTAKFWPQSIPMWGVKVVVPQHLLPYCSLFHNLCLQDTLLIHIIISPSALSVPMYLQWHIYVLALPFSIAQMNVEAHCFPPKLLFTRDLLWLSVCLPYPQELCSSLSGSPNFVMILVYLRLSICPPLNLCYALL